MRKRSMDELDRLSVEAFKKAAKNPIVLILDNVRSLNNVGSAFRTADAFLVEKIYLCGITGTPPHREIHKTALGATESVSWEYQENTLDLVRELRRSGYQICVLEQASHSLPLNRFQPKPDQAYALVFGNEVFGVEEEVLEHADQVLEIPQLGTKHSLNISVSIGIALWDLVNKTQGLES
ncbi:RNA methyltransferase [Cyclobacterium jeungdonense]|uniref:RNA methyltransferase n=1 Tax=Cyclobacterium jeungdonense TaxID=708087 RepID=A0ABT8C6C4_9BACT|nr:RNA methyltransferase [Cyclobacterium jeungdonense]MDN3687270.1 RNA methyltransferase [Cyclobacterium jeungdonense]